MIAYVYSERVALDALAAVERPDPVPGPRDVVLRMRAVALNNRDLAIARGRYHVAVAAPLVPVSDGAGEVIQIGAEVRRVAVGDLACPTYLPDWIDGPLDPRFARRRLGGPDDGVLRELACFNEDEVVRVPAHLEAAEAATLPVAAVTAWHSLFELGTLRPGETLAILGTGGVSLAALQLARAGGARVVVVTRSERQRARLLELGASEVITSADGADWPAQIRKLTNGAGADVVLDVVGGALERSIAATRVGGKVHLVGYVADTQAAFDIFDAIRHAVTIQVAAAGNRHSFEALLRVIDQQKIRPVVDRTFRMAEFREAFDYLASGGHFGKVVLTFD